MRCVGNSVFVSVEAVDVSFVDPTKLVVSSLNRVVVDISAGAFDVSIFAVSVISFVNIVEVTSVVETSAYVALNNENKN